MDGQDFWNCDFECPQFVDFAGPNALDDDDQADKYFEYDHENGVPVHLEGESPQSPAEFKTPNANLAENSPRTNTPRLTRSAKAKTPVANVVEKNEPASTPRLTRSAKEKTPVAENSQKVPNNICTNMEDWKKKTAAKVENGAKVAECEPAQRVQELRPTNKRQHRSLERSDSLPKRLKTEVPVVRSRTPNKSTGLARSRSFSTNPSKGPHARGYSGDSRGFKPKTTIPPVKSEPEKPTITVPTTPTFMKRKGVKLITHEPVKTAEERELEKIAFFRKELARKRKEASESCKAALSAKIPTQAASTRELTRPQSFKFETDTRIKTHPMETRSAGDGKNFQAMLRSDKDKHTPSGAKAGPTVPEPFNLTSQRKRKLPDMDQKQAEKFESMAERIKAFSATPERFRSKSKTEAQPQGKPRLANHPTVPKTPQFETRTRSRPVNIPSRQQMESKEVEEMQRQQFKAHPVNQRILANPNCGVRKIPSRPVTVTEEFHLSSKNKRLERSQENEEHYEFHAQPLNKKILQGPMGIKSPMKAPLTVPESPAFALKHRARLPQEPEPKEQEKPTLRSRTAHHGIPFQPQLEHKTTQPMPFGFEQRDKKRAAEKMRQIEQYIEEENRQREFYANPIPDASPHLPAKKKKPLTVKQPFNLGTERRGMKKAEEWSHKLEEELRHQKEMARFKAAEPAVLEKQPFVPKKETKVTTDFSEFELNTAKRVSKREAFETHLKVKQDHAESIRRQERLIKEAEEAAAFEQQRRDATHKAKPVKHYKGIELKPSQKALTAPMSPMFRTDDRLRTRNQHMSSTLST